MAEAAPCLSAESQQLCLSLPESYTKQIVGCCSLWSSVLKYTSINDRIMFIFKGKYLDTSQGAISFIEREVFRAIALKCSKVNEMLY